jgi:hypothetical protein
MGRVQPGSSVCLLRGLSSRTLVEPSHCDHVTNHKPALCSCAAVQEDSIHRFLGDADKYYCGRRLGVSAIPGSDGRCGPNDGPQCMDCKLFQASLMASCRSLSLLLALLSQVGWASQEHRVLVVWSLRSAPVFHPMLCVLPFVVQGGVEHGSLYVGVIPAKKLRCALRKFGGPITEESALLLWDDTVFGSADNGLWHSLCSRALGVPGPMALHHRFPCRCTVVAARVSTLK